MKINDILCYAPIPDQIKKTLLEQMRSLSHRVLSDKTVFMLAVMLIVFDDDTDSKFSHIRDQYTNMLRWKKKKEKLICYFFLDVTWINVMEGRICQTCWMPCSPASNICPSWLPHSEWWWWIRINNTEYNRIDPHHGRLKKNIEHLFSLYLLSCE